MKRIVIICEGETEQEFCDKSLSNHFNPKDIYIQAPRIKHSNGGIVRWDRLKRQIETTLREDRQAYVTLLIDYYGLYEKYKFPGLSWKCFIITAINVFLKPIRKHI